MAMQARLRDLYCFDVDLALEMNTITTELAAAHARDVLQALRQARACLGASDEVLARPDTLRCLDLSANQLASEEGQAAASRASEQTSRRLTLREQTMALERRIEQLLPRLANLQRYR